MTRKGTFEIVLRTPWAGPWRWFSDPAAVIRAHERNEVRDALHAVDDAVRRGRYAAGFVTYEAASAFGLSTGPPAPGLPLLAFGLFDPENVDTLERLPSTGAATIGGWTPSLDHGAYLDAIDAIKAYIEAGDTYQVNFTFRLAARFSGEPSALMRDLYAGQAGAWSAYVDLGERVICAASPELFYRVEGRKALCRPMKGTWPRGYWPAQDVAQGEALRDSAKNRAENVMIVDMVRNDLGRVAKTGSVNPVSLFNVERYPLQWQMTSDVEALVEEPGLARMFEAMFPCGSITGAPKHRSMEIIRELESSPRGIYTGAIGYISPRGRSHFNVAIRTVVVDREEGRAEFGVGSGIVWDSVDRDEYDECLLKAEMLGGRASPKRSASYVIGDPPGFRLLETILWRVNGGFALLDRHLDRLRASADCFGFACDLADVRAALHEAVEDLRVPARVRVMVEADGTVLCEAVDLVPVREPVRLALASSPVNRFDVFLYHKTTKRGLYDRARASRPDADAVVLWNEEEEITESTECNIVIVRSGRRITPPIECGLLPGTMRAELLDAEEIVEDRVTKADYLAAEEVWLINSVRGWLRAEVL